ncbi:kinase-like domain-containing protein [Xylariaceae sp. FL0804]|nr:kinase-like domain-containing protein [Xylariaceae sp. FL0804]
MANKSQADVSFSKEVLRLRAEYEHCRYGQCVRIFDVPGTLSGDILRLYRNLPPLSSHSEIDGDDIPVRPLDCCLEHPELLEDESEDVNEHVSQLPLICVDPKKHFVKKGKYRSEIVNLIRCQGASVPGHSLSPNTLIDALDCLHSVGIVHRELRANNLVFSNDGERLVVCDLESRWGERSAPEVDFQGGLEDSGWTTKSDIYDTGNCIKSMVYANGPITHFAIVEACMRPRPEERPTLADLRIMVVMIQT